MTDAIPAATLILFRGSASTVAEHLFVERSAKMAFAGGATVFPGGRIDPQDHDLAVRFPSLDPEDAAARIAAIRETIEEAGVGIGLAQHNTRTAPAMEQLTSLRTRLHAGDAFGATLDRMNLSIDPEALSPFARWRPNFRESRTFDTRFYIAQADDAHAHASADKTENVHLFWDTAESVLQAAANEALRVIFPTRRNLERLATLRTFDAAVSQAHRIAPEMITPWIETRDGTPHLCIPEGRGYPVTAEPLGSAMRG